MKAKEFRQKTKDELRTMLTNNQEKLRKLRFDLANKKLKNTSQIKYVKKEIAKLLTCLKVL